MSDFFMSLLMPFPNRYCNNSRSVIISSGLRLGAFGSSVIQKYLTYSNFLSSFSNLTVFLLIFLLEFEVMLRIDAIYGPFLETVHLLLLLPALQLLLWLSAPSVRIPISLDRSLLLVRETSYFGLSLMRWWSLWPEVELPDYFDWFSSFFHLLTTSLAFPLISLLLPYRLLILLTSLPISVSLNSLVDGTGNTD